MSELKCPKCKTFTLDYAPSYLIKGGKPYDVVKCSKCDLKWYRATREADDEVMEFNPERVVSEIDEREISDDARQI